MTQVIATALYDEQAAVKASLDKETMLRRQTEADNEVSRLSIRFIITDSTRLHMSKCSGDNVP